MDETRLTEEGELRATSDNLLLEVEALRSLEEAKRRTPIGTDEFVRLADEVAEAARRVSSRAEVERRLAREAATAIARGELPSVRVLDVESRPVHRILADWREATVRFEQAERGSDAQSEAARDVHRLRLEYHTAIQRSQDPDARLLRP